MIDIVNRAHNSKNGKNSRKPWKWMIVDSAIIGGISFFSSLIEGSPTAMTFYKAVVAYGLAFFVQLAIERGLKRQNI